MVDSMAVWHPRRRPRTTVTVEELKIAMRAQAREARLTRSDRLRTVRGRGARRSRPRPSRDRRGLRASPSTRRARRSRERCPLMVALAERGVRVLVPLLGDGLQRGWGEFLGADDLTPARPGDPPSRRAPSFPRRPSPTPTSSSRPRSPSTHGDAARPGRRLVRPLPPRRAADGAVLLAFCFPEEVSGEDDPVPREAARLPGHGVVTPDGRDALRPLTGT